MRVEAPPLGGWEASKGIQNLESITSGCRAGFLIIIPAFSSILDE